MADRNAVWICNVAGRLAYAMTGRVHPLLRFVGRGMSATTLSVVVEILLFGRCFRRPPRTAISGGSPSLELLTGKPGARSVPMLRDVISLVVPLEHAAVRAAPLRQHLALRRCFRLEPAVTGDPSCDLRERLDVRQTYDADVAHREVCPRNNDLHGRKPCALLRGLALPPSPRAVRRSACLDHRGITTTDRALHARVPADFSAHAVGSIARSAASRSSCDKQPKSPRSRRPSRSSGDRVTVVQVLV